MGHQNRGPRSRDADAREVHDDVEGLLSQDGVEEHADEAEGRGDDDRPVGHVVPVHADGEARAGAGHGQGSQGAARRVEPGVEGGERRGEDHDLDDVARMCDADALEEGDEGGFALRVRGVGQDQRHERHGAHVEDEDADDHRVDGLRQDPLRLLRLARGHSDHLGAAEGEDDAEDQRQRREEALGEEAAVLGDVVESRRVVGDCVPRGDRPDGDRHESEDRGHLDRGEPEFRLAEHLDAEHVEDEDQGKGDERDDPLGDALERRPIVHVHGDGRDVRHDGHRPVEEEHPARDVGALLARELAGVGDEGPRGGAADRQLSERADHEEGEDSAYSVGDDQAGPALGQPPARAEEQPRSDGSPDGDHLNVAGLEPLVVSGVAPVVRRRGRRRRRRVLHLLHRSSCRGHPPCLIPAPAGAPCAEGDSAESPVLIPAGQAGARRLWIWACGASPAWELGFRSVPYTVAAPGGSLATRRAVRGAGRNASIGMVPDD